MVNWNELGFDIVGGNEYLSRAWYFESQKMKDLQDLKRYGKPLWVTEIGCCTYDGASNYGGGGGDSPFMQKEKYNEQEQATNTVDTIILYSKSGLDGVFLYQLAQGKWKDNEYYFGILRWDPSARLWLRKTGFYVYQSFTVS